MLAPTQIIINGPSATFGKEFNMVKYGSIIFYYDILYAQVIEEYKNNNNINNEIIKLCAEIMNNYYAGVTYIDNLFNA